MGLFTIDRVGNMVIKLKGHMKSKCEGTIRNRGSIPQSAIWDHVLNLYGLTISIFKGFLRRHQTSSHLEFSEYGISDCLCKPELGILDSLA
jgi:hypothetical protein